MLKIDRSFVQDVLSNSDSATITDAIIGLAKSLRLTITAEGIETQEQRDYLQERGCDEGQGFYFSRPVTADTITEMLKNSLQPAAASDAAKLVMSAAGAQRHDSLATRHMEKSVGNYAETLI